MFFMLYSSRSSLQSLWECPSLKVCTLQAKEMLGKWRMLSTLLKVLSTVNFSVHSLFLHTQHTSHLDWPHRKSLTNLFIEILEIEMEINNFLELRDTSPNPQDRLTRGFRFAAQDWGCNTQQWAINLCPSESKLKKQSHYVCRHLLIKRNVGAAGQKVHKLSRD